MPAIFTYAVVALLIAGMVPLLMLSAMVSSDVKSAEMRSAALCEMGMAFSIFGVAALALLASTGHPAVRDSMVKMTVLVVLLGSVGALACVLYTRNLRQEYRRLLKAPL